MPDSTIFARVFPHSIKVTEKYSYTTLISHSQQMEEKQNEKPNSSIEILIPYDGEKYFTIQAAEDIQRQKAQIGVAADANVRIGYLSLSNYDNTDLAAHPELKLQYYDTAPLELLWRQHQLPDEASLFGNLHTCYIKYEYTAQWPKIIPIRLKVNIFDEDPLDQLDNKVWDLLGESAPTDRQKAIIVDAADSLIHQRDFNREVIFEFQVIVKLPEPIGRDNDDKPPKLTKIGIQWPLTLSHSQATLQLVAQRQKGQTVRVQYNPESRTIEWRDITLLSRKTKSKRTNLYFYKTPPMRLAIQQPGELYQMDTLEGKLDVKLPRTFSGLQIEHFNAIGQQSQPPSDPEKPLIKPETVISLDFTLKLADCFTRKIHSPYQHLRFDGVILDEMRISDITNILQDYGFMVRYRSVELQRSPKNYYLIAACQKRALEDLWLWLLVEEKPFQTTRERKITGDHTYKTLLDAGNLTVYMQGKLIGDKNHLINLMNDVQVKIKEQFRQMSVVG